MADTTRRNGPARIDHFNIITYYPYHYYYDIPQMIPPIFSLDIWSRRVLVFSSCSFLLFSNLDWAVGYTPVRSFFFSSFWTGGLVFGSCCIGSSFYTRICASSALGTLVTYADVLHDWRTIVNMTCIHCWRLVFWSEHSCPSLAEYFAWKGLRLPESFS